MNKLYKTILASIAILVSTTSFSQDGEILVTAKKAGNNIDIIFDLLNDGGVSALQFDIELPNSQTKAMNIVDCTSSMGKSQLAGCSLNGNILRVALLNKNLQDISSGQVGHVAIKNAKGILNKELKISNAKLVDNKGNEKSISAIIDYKNIKVLNSADFERK